MAEATPLMHDIEQPTSHIDNTNDEFEPTDLSAKQPAYFKILNIITLILSVVVVALLIANAIIIRHAPLSYSDWGARQATKVLGKWIFASVVFSFVSIFVNFPILLNVIANVVFPWGIIVWVVRLFEGLPTTDWCRVDWRYPRPIPEPDPSYPDPKCKHWRSVIKILMLIAGVLAIIIATIYLCRLALRGVAIIRRKFWERPLAWSVPTGTLSFEISIKFLKQEESAIGSRSEQTAEGSGSGRGPLYL